jgi:hypothetical protein
MALVCATLSPAYTNTWQNPILVSPGALVGSSMGNNLLSFKKSRKFVDFGDKGRHEGKKRKNTRKTVSFI